MKKPAKPKPKRRANTAAQPAAAKAVAGAKRKPVLRAAAATGPASPARQQQIDLRAVPRTATMGFAHEDRAALALLLLPFMIVALSLGMSQTRRPTLPALPDILARAPIERTAASHAPITMPLPPPPVELPGRIGYPPPVPDLSVASLDARSPALATPPLPVIVLTTPLSYPVGAPEISLPAVAFASPVPPGLLAPELTTPLSYPLAAPEIAIASLDARGLDLPAVGVPPTAVSPGPVAAPAGPQVCEVTDAQAASFSAVGRLARRTRQPLLTGLDPETFGRRIAAAAVAQTRDLVIYTARYQPMAYPMGDVVALHGACIDVIIRAYRTVGIDLQEEVQRARSGRGDPNIDHRRTENMRAFLARQGASLPITAFPEDYKPGDIVTYHRPFSRVSTSHIAIVSDVLAPTGRPMIVHNRGYGPQLEDALFVDRITGHYRYLGKPSATAAGPSPQAAASQASRPVVRASFPASGASAQQ